MTYVTNYCTEYFTVTYVCYFLGVFIDMNVHNMIIFKTIIKFQYSVKCLIKLMNTL